MTTKKAIGQRGSWFATVDGEALPCVHKHWVKGLYHHDPFRRHEGGASDEKILELATAVQQLGRVILTDDDAELDTAGNVVGFKRKNYIAVFEVEDVTYSREDGLRFRLARRVCDLL